MNIKWYWWIIIAAIMFALGYKCSSTQEPIIESRIDTFTVHTPIPVEKKTVDTLKFKVPTIVHDTVLSQSIRYETINDTTYLVLDKTQNYYKEQDLYEAWVSGVEPSLDSIKVFNKTEVITEKPPAFNIWVGGDFIYNKSSITNVNLGLSYKLKHLQLEVGYNISTDSKLNGPLLGVRYYLK